MKKIIALTDFSSASQKALKVADGLADQLGAQLFLVHIYFSFHYYHGSVTGDIEKQMINVARKSLEEQVARSQLNSKVYTKLLLNLSFSEMLEEQDLDQTDLIVMGRQGSGKMERFFLGSSTTRMMRSTDCPIMIVPENIDSFKADDILFASNFYGEAEPVFRNVSSLRAALNARLHLLKVITPDAFEATKFSQKLINQLIEGNEKDIASKEIRNNISTAEGILEYADEIKADLIAVGSHPRSSVRAAFDLALSEDLAAKSKVPILAYKLKKIKY